MSELADTIQVLEEHERRLDALDLAHADVSARVDELIENVNVFEQRICKKLETIDGLFVIMRDAITEECRLLREGIVRGRR